MIEETARHAGHLGVMREEIDGVVGEWSESDCLQQDLATSRRS
jgi:hypothetical protein